MSCIEKRRFIYSKNPWYAFYIFPVPSYGFPQLYGNLDNISIFNFTTYDSIIYTSIPNQNLVLKLKIHSFENIEIIGKYILPKASSPHGILVTKKFLYITLNDNSEILKYKTNSNYAIEKFKFEIPICPHECFTFDDVILYIVDQNQDVYIYDTIENRLEAITKNYWTVMLMPKETMFVINVYTTNREGYSDQKTQTGFMIFEKSKKFRFVPFETSFLSFGIQSSHICTCNNLVFVSYLTGNVFGYKSLDNDYSIAFQTADSLFHFIEVVYSCRYDTLFIISSSIVENSTDALVFIKNFLNRFPLVESHKDIQLNIDEYDTIVFPQNVSCHRIVLENNEDTILITCARSGKLLSFYTPFLIS